MDRIEKLRMFIGRNPDDLFSRHALALELLKGGYDMEALKEMEALLETDETYLGTYYHLAKLYEKLKHYDKARNAYQTGIRLAEKMNDSQNLRELKGALFLLEDELDT